MQAPGSTFHKIGPRVWFKDSQNSHSSATSINASGILSPDLIMIFGWMGATLTGLKKYVSVYEDLYPNAAKLVIGCHPAFFWIKKSAQLADLAPVIRALDAVGFIPTSSKSSSDARPRVLIHVFSNGGSAQLVCLGRLLATRFPDWSAFGPSTSMVIMDSCPGVGGLRHALNTMKPFARKALLRYILYVAITCLHIVHAIRRQLFGTKHTLEMLKHDLYNPRLLPWMDARTPRLYMYSKKDQLVPYREVEEHINILKASGFPVYHETFIDTPHVSHARGHPAQYWGAVRSIWAKACEQAVGDQTNLRSKGLAKL